jgi:hypothetical protein
MSHSALATLMGHKETPGTQGGYKMKGKKEDISSYSFRCQNFL